MVKLSYTMKQNLNYIPDDGEAKFYYQSTLDPLQRRGLITVERRTDYVPMVHYYARLTPLGRAAKHSNHPD